MSFRPGAGLLTVLLVLLAGVVNAAEPPALARARALYNAADYDGAISAAAMARTVATAADAASLVTGRSHLQRYRQRGESADLAAARDALAAVRAATLTPRDQVDHLVGLGQALYLGNTFGAAAELFDAALCRGAALGHGDRLRLLDWWATALDRDAQDRPADRRQTAYGRISARMEEELGEDPGSVPANYWLAAAARGAGDLDRAWSASAAAWIRARLSPETAETARADLDRLVTEVLIPERTRTKPARDPLAEWQRFKLDWP